MRLVYLHLVEQRLVVLDIYPAAVDSQIPHGHIDFGVLALDLITNCYAT